METVAGPEGNGCEASLTHRKLHKASQSSGV